MSESEPISTASAVVICSAGDDARHGARERHSNFNHFVSPVWRGGRRHGQTDVVFASRPVTAGRLALVFRSRHDGAGLRAFGQVAARGDSLSPFVRDTGGSLHRLTA